MSDKPSHKPSDKPSDKSSESLRAAAAALGRRGGLKGGPARARALSARRRREIARKASFARWGRVRKKPG